MLEGSRTTSLRDVYYALEHLFRNQAECNSIVLRLGEMLGLRRRTSSTTASYDIGRSSPLCRYSDELGIVPATKGSFTVNCPHLIALKMQVLCVETFAFDFAMDLCATRKHRGLNVETVPVVSAFVGTG